MAQQFGAQVEQMQAAAQHVATVNDNVQAQLSRLYNQVEPLSRVWQGQAAIAFQMLLQRWHADARKLSEALTTIGERTEGDRPVSDGTILVSLSELESARESITTTWKNISQELEELKSYLKPMVDTWTGDASIAYQALQAQWAQSAKDLNQVLNQIGVALGTSNELPGR